MSRSEFKSVSSPQSFGYRSCDYAPPPSLTGKAMTCNILVFRPLIRHQPMWVGGYCINNNIIILLLLASIQFSMQESDHTPKSASN